MNKKLDGAMNMDRGGRRNWIGIWIGISIRKEDVEEARAKENAKEVQEGWKYGPDKKYR